jgi:hypothetical protein
MGELDAEWERRVVEAAERARASGRADIADYLALRAANDVARAAGLAWLFDTFTALADEALLHGADLRLAHDEEHSFRVSHSTMIGRRLTIHCGAVRALAIEAGWPRVPRDGVVRGRGLARARLSHFGERGADEELLLVKPHDAAPRWIVSADSDERAKLDASQAGFDESRAREHLAKLLG